MQIPKGTVAGVYGYHRGWVGERNIVSVGIQLDHGDHVDPPKPLEHGHVVQVFGTAQHAHGAALPAAERLDTNRDSWDSA